MLKGIKTVFGIVKYDSIIENWTLPTILFTFQLDQFLLKTFLLFRRTYLVLITLRNNIWLSCLSRGNVRINIKIILPLNFKIRIDAFSMITTKIKEWSWGIVIVMMTLSYCAIEIKILMLSIYFQRLCFLLHLYVMIC